MILNWISQIWSKRPHLQSLHSLNPLRPKTVPMSPIQNLLARINTIKAITLLISCSMQPHTKSWIYKRPQWIWSLLKNPQLPIARTPLSLTLNSMMRSTNLWWIRKRKNALSKMMLKTSSWHLWRSTTSTSSITSELLVRSTTFRLQLSIETCPCPAFPIKQAPTQLQTFSIKGSPLSKTSNSPSTTTKITTLICSWGNHIRECWMKRGLCARRCATCE